MNTKALIRFGYVVFTYLTIPLICLHLLYKSLGDSNYLKRINERFGLKRGSPEYRNNLGSRRFLW